MKLISALFHDFDISTISTQATSEVSSALSAESPTSLKKSANSSLDLAWELSAAVSGDFQVTFKTLLNDYGDRKESAQNIHLSAQTPQSFSNIKTKDINYFLLPFHPTDGDFCKDFFSPNIDMMKKAIQNIITNRSTIIGVMDEEWMTKIPKVISRINDLQGFKLKANVLLAHGLEGIGF